MSADVAILVVTYNSARQIAACLRSVFTEQQTVTQQVIVLDNGSTDDTVAIVREGFPQVTVVQPGSNLGFAAGVNMAARHANADYLLLLNPDTIVLDHAVDVVVAFARSHPSHGLYGGRTLKPDGSLEPSSCWGLPTLWSLTMFASGLSTLARRNRFLDPESLGTWPRDSVREVGVITGCFLLVRRTVWDELSGFDERYFMYGEDTDLSARARAAGYQPVICPDARLIHEIGQSSPTPRSKMLLLYRGKASYVRTHWTGLRVRLGLWLLVVGVGARALGTRVVALSSAHDHGESTWTTLWRQRRTWIVGYTSAQGLGAVEHHGPTCLGVQ